MNRFFIRIDQGELPPPGGPVKSRLAVRALVERGGRFLMVHSSLGGYQFPGGGVQQRETPEEALMREVQEETGYEIQGRFRVVGRTVERARGRDVPGSMFKMESLYFTAEVAEEPGPLALEDYERDLGYEPLWMPAAEALAANWALAHREGADIPWLRREIGVLEQLLR